MLPLVQSLPGVDVAKQRIQTPTSATHKRPLPDVAIVRVWAESVDKGRTVKRASFNQPLAWRRDNVDGDVMANMLAYKETPAAGPGPPSRSASSAPSTARYPRSSAPI